MNQLEKQDEVIEIYKRDGWRCGHCGLSVYRHGTLQLAHRIAKTQANIKKYGKTVIDHPLNRVGTCCLYCNGRMNIGFNTAEAEELADKIRNAMLKE
jgi:hypothetical protein